MLLFQFRPVLKSINQGQTAVILTALSVETQAVLRHLSDVSGKSVSGTGCLEGRFEEWNIAVAEVGAGNVGAAAITVRACEHYNPAVALSDAYARAWLRLGIRLERIRPGHPEQNGRHERMHLTLKKETTRPAARNFLQQQDRFDRFIALDDVQRRANKSHLGDFTSGSRRSN
jgi:hypothetical protein